MGADHALPDVQGLSRAFVSPAGQLVCVRGASGSGKSTLVVVCSHDPLCLEFADVAVEMSDGRLRIGVTR